MRDFGKLCLAVFYALLVFSFASAQPQPPHRVYGNVTSSGSGVQGLNVTARVSGDILDSDLTSETGFYDISVSGLNPDDVFWIFIQSENGSKVNFTSGASERLDFSGSYSSPEQGQGDNTTGTDPGTGSEGDSSGGGFSGGGSGGGMAPDQKSQVRQELDFEVSLGEDNSARLDMGSLKEGQTVKVRITGQETYLEGFSFDVDRDSDSVTLDVSSMNQKPQDVEEPGFRVFRYYRIDLEGLQQFSGASVSYQLPKQWLVSRSNSSEDFIFKEYIDSWNSASSSVITESFDVYSLESSVSSPGLFASGVESVSRVRDSPGIQVTEFRVESSEVNPFRINISAKVVNQGNSSVSQNLTLYSGQKRIEVARVSLEPGQSRFFTFSSNISSTGLHRFTFAGETATITVNPSQNNQSDGAGFSIALMIGGAGLFVILTVLVGYIYFIEYRRAKELDETVDYLESQSERVGDRMKDVRRDLDRMRSQLGGRETGENDRG
ncbi:MAG: PGF-pre-PGF domain-containing protein [Candidatus Nanosalina sp.]